MKKREQIIFVENVFADGSEAEFSKKVTDAVNNIIISRIKEKINKQYYGGKNDNDG